MNERFKIIFDEIDRMQNSNTEDNRMVIEIQQLQSEMEEIDALRQLALDVSDLEPQSYTIT